MNRDLISKYCNISLRLKTMRWQVERSGFRKVASSERNSGNNESSLYGTHNLPMVPTIVDSFWQVLVLLSTTIGYKM